jgi:hypothetical protein
MAGHSPATVMRASALKACILLLQTPKGTTSMSKKFQKVEVRLPPVAARAQTQRIDRPPLPEDLKVTSLLSSTITQPVAQARSAENQALALAVTAKRRQAKTNASNSEACSSFAFTAGDMCAQLDVLSRPMYQCDALLPVPVSASSRATSHPAAARSSASEHMHVHVESSSHAHWQPSREQARGALARLGSAGGGVAAKAAVQTPRDDVSSAPLNKLFSLDHDVLLRRGLHDGNAEKLTSFSAALSASASSPPSAAAAAAADDRDCSSESLPRHAADDGNCSFEVLDVWVDETDGTTGSSNSTGLAARDLLRLSQLAHDCTKSKRFPRFSSAAPVLTINITPQFQALT